MELSTPPTGKVVFTPKNFLTPQAPSPTGGVNSSYTYPDNVHAILSYRRLLQKPKLLQQCVLRNIRFEYSAATPGSLS